MSLQESVAELWARRDELREGDVEATRTVEEALAALDAGEVRVAEVDPGGEVVVHEWVKHAVLLSFRLFPIADSSAGPFHYRDRLPVKSRFDGVRVLPGAIARYGSYLAPGVVLMPSFTNVGARVGEGTMVDTWATVGSCAQVGERVHLAGGVGIGGVLEPAQAAPVVIEDGAFVGSRAIVVEGARVRAGAVLGAGTVLTSSTRVFDAESGDELPRGEVPERAVVVNSARLRTFPGGEFAMPCLLVLRRLPEGEGHAKAALNDLLREHGLAT